MESAYILAFILLISAVASRNVQLYNEVGEALSYPSNAFVLRGTRAAQDLYFPSTETKRVLRQSLDPRTCPKGKVLVNKICIKPKSSQGTLLATDTMNGWHARVV